MFSPKNMSNLGRLTVLEENILFFGLHYEKKTMQVFFFDL
jgi:hypothetical protein